ncbi:hypothetical protein [Periweissella fabalis]|uniref:Uncharacterized protein n=1 Tax=Periweissella fabalis TaxID=1070421 RepID=A0A7X6S234_9LACO|nr:hypothetical protein [Periweissella fabalis]MCM0599276.1 hypothetical protein [Periweissella fabalis]NKZ23555.1 hypothetical protein [Periweissella fabalis]
MDIFLSFSSPNQKFLIELGMTQYQHVVVAETEFNELANTTLLIAPSHLGSNFTFIIDQRYPTPFHIKISMANLLIQHSYYTYAQVNKHLLSECHWPYQTNRLPFTTPKVVLMPITMKDTTTIIWLNPLTITQLEDLHQNSTYLHILIKLVNYHYVGVIKANTNYQLTRYRIGETLVLHEYLVNTYLSQFIKNLSATISPFEMLTPSMYDNLSDLQHAFYQTQHADYHTLDNLRMDSLLTSYRAAVLYETEKLYLTAPITKRVSDAIMQININKIRTNWYKDNN